MAISAYRTQGKLNMTRDQRNNEIYALLLQLNNAGCDYRHPLYCLGEAVMQYNSTEVCNNSAYAGFSEAVRADGVLNFQESIAEA